MGGGYRQVSSVGWFLDKSNRAHTHARAHTHYQTSCFNHFSDVNRPVLPVDWGSDAPPRVTVGIQAQIEEKKYSTVTEGVKPRPFL